MKEYLAFDIEIARDFNKISIHEFQPEKNEAIKIWVDIDGNQIWVDATYKAPLFKLRSGDFVTSNFWQPADNSDWKRFRPLGITCAAAASSDGGLWNWYAHDAMGKFTDKMSKSQCHQLAEDLVWLSDDYQILTWNGLGFDFDVMAEESGHHKYCQDLALSHIDMMFHFFASKGYPLGLDAASKGMGLPGKPPGMDGAKAPMLWAEGQYHKVLDYVSWDCKNTLGVAQAVNEAGCLSWIAKSGRPNTWLCDKWLTVKEAMALPKPDTSWMSDPWSREKFYEWTGYELPIETVAPIDEISDDMNGTNWEDGD